MRKCLPFIDEVIDMEPGCIPPADLLPAGENFVYVPFGTLFLREIDIEDLFQGDYLCLPVTERVFASGDGRRSERELCLAIRRQRGLAKRALYQCVEDTVLPLRLSDSFPWGLFTGEDEVPFPRNLSFWTKAAALSSYYDLETTAARLAAGRVDIRSRLSDLPGILRASSHSIIHLGGVPLGEGDPFQSYQEESLIDTLETFIGEL